MTTITPKFCIEWHDRIESLNDEQLTFVKSIVLMNLDKRKTKGV